MSCYSKRCFKLATRTSKLLLKMRSRKGTSNNFDHSGWCLRQPGCKPKTKKHIHIMVAWHVQCISSPSVVHLETNSWTGHSSRRRDVARLSTRSMRCSHRLPAPETGHHLRPKRKTSGDLLEGAADVAIGISKGLFNHRVPVLAIFPGHALLQAALSYSTLGQFQKPPA